MQHVLVTGGSRGIGRATCLLAARRGWSVSLNFLRDAEAAALVCETVRRAGGRAEPLQGDIADEHDVLKIFEKAEAKFGALTGVVINAGIVANASALADMTADRLRRMFEVNVLGAYFCAREAARRMSTSQGGKGGSIVIV
ncbi:MAG TPA: SDR family NAD(P)-dependent oxidoreductase, partial [Afifellaceae bacterium]|nr:SDR family NAD(P)-dependent oxidoreductase [Afifellaceae bacterium]